MADRYQQLASSRLGGQVVKRLGLPRPLPLRRYEPGQPALVGPVVSGAAAGGRLAKTVASVAGELGAAITDDDDRPGALIFDASGITDTADLAAVYAFFQPRVRAIRTHGRIVVLGTPPGPVAQRALEGFVRALGKEVGRAVTVQLVRVEPGAEEAAESTLRFLLSARSAFVSGQVVTVRAGGSTVDRAARVGLVTGAARGIGAAIVGALARNGVTVVCVDVPAQGDALSQVADDVGGTAVQLDITADDAPKALADHVKRRYGGVDVVVHNAGIIRDRTLARMKPARWDDVIAVNLLAPERLTAELLGRGLVNDGGRLIGISSISGIAGQAGQTNYATSKAGVIGWVESLAPVLTSGITVNAVAPGFIETQMTASLPVFIREAGRRMSSLGQGGRPVDVAETVAWLAEPDSGGLTGQIVRVCGQSLLGA